MELVWLIWCRCVVQVVASRGFAATTVIWFVTIWLCCAVGGCCGCSLAGVLWIVFVIWWLLPVDFVCLLGVGFDGLGGCLICG